MALRKDFTSVCIIPNQLEDDILKCNTKFELTTMDVYLIIQGSIQEERSRHLQEDLNASKEKYEKSLEEVKSVRDWCRSLSIPWDLKIRFVKANFSLLVLQIAQKEEKIRSLQNAILAEKEQHAQRVQQVWILFKCKRRRKRGETSTSHLISLFWNATSFALPLDQKKPQSALISIVFPRLIWQSFHSVTISHILTA